MRRLALSLSVALCLLIVAGIGGYILLQPGFLAPAIQAAVKARTGKDIAFAAPPRLVLWPEPVVVYPEVALGGPDSKLLRAGELRIKTNLGALISKRVEIVSVELIEPHLELRISKDGAANWDLPGGDGPALEYRTTGGSLSYADERYGHRFEAKEIAVSGVFGASGPSFQSRGTLVWNNQAAGFELFVKSAQRLAADGSPVSVTIDGASGQFSFDGRAAIAWGFGLAGQAEIAARDLRALLKWLGLPLGGAGGFKDIKLTAAMDAAAGQITFKDAALKIDGASALGGLSVKMAKNGPALDGDLTIDRLDLMRYVPWLAGETWRAAALDFGALKDWSGDIKLQARDIAAGPLAFRNAPLDLSLHNGRLAITAKPFAAMGGTVSGVITLDGAQAEPAAAISLTLAQTASRLIRANADVSLSVETSGATIETMISRLNGAVRATARDGLLTGFDAVALLAKASERIVEGWEQAKNGATPFSELSASFRIADGIMTTNDGALLSEAISVPFSGDIDLLREALDLKFQPVLPGGAALPVPVIARGPWAGPRIFADIPGILENPEAAYRALKKAGMPETP